MLVTFNDIVFVLAGLFVVWVGFYFRPAKITTLKPPAVHLSELVLTGLALAVAAVGPNILVVALTPGQPNMKLLGQWLLVPSLFLIFAIWAISKNKYPRLSNRIATGIWVGASSTAALDVVRLSGFSLGQMPANLPRMFGVLLFDRMALGPSTLSDFIGSLYHYWVGACLGLAYALVLGNFRWWAGVLWGLIIELGMMTTPPMVIAMDTGYFGLKFGAGLLIASLIAHIVFGLTLGLLMERYLQHSGSIFSLFKGAWPISRIKQMARYINPNMH